MYAVQASIFTDGVVDQLPTFYLDESVQGIVNVDHAKEIALTIINPRDKNYVNFLNVWKM